MVSCGNKSKIEYSLKRDRDFPANYLLISTGLLEGWCSVPRRLFACVVYTSSSFVKAAPLKLSKQGRGSELHGRGKIQIFAATERERDEYSPRALDHITVFGTYLPVAPTATRHMALLRT